MTIISILYLYDMVSNLTPLYCNLYVSNNFQLMMSSKDKYKTSIDKRST